MKRTLKKGFTLIELMVVIAIIGILATTLAPKLREQLAKAKDSKAVSFLGASRTVASSLIISHMTGTVDSGSETIKIDWKDLSSQMDVTTKGLISATNGELIVGGSRDNASNDLKYGGTVRLVSATTNSIKATDKIDLSATSGGGMEIENASELHLFKNTAAGILSTSEKSTEGKQWSAY